MGLTRHPARPTPPDTTSARRIALSPAPVRPVVRRGLLAFGVLVGLCTVAAHAAGEPARKDFNVPAEDASVSLRLFAEQSGQEIIYPADGVRGITTNPVRGQFTAREALDQLVAGKDLVVAQSKTTGALAVTRRPPDPNGPRAAQGITRDRPTSQP